MAVRDEYNDSFLLTSMGDYYFDALDHVYYKVMEDAIHEMVSTGNRKDKLKKAGLKKMSIAYDMDSYSNPHVHKALLKVEDFLYESDVDFEILTWDPRFKGIDDYLKHVMH